MKKKYKKTIVMAVVLAILVISIMQVAFAEPRVRITQRVSVPAITQMGEGGETYWTIGEVSRIGPGGYAPINWCIENEDEILSLKGYYVTFILDPTLTMGGMEWAKIKEESNGPTGYKWTFGDNVKYEFANSFFLALMGNYARDFYNIFSTKDAKRVDLHVSLAVTEEEPEEPSYFAKFIENDIFGVTLQIPDLEPTSRAGKHSWCIEEGVSLSWFQRTNRPSGHSTLRPAHIYPQAYIVVGNDANLGEEHKLVALVCSADPNSIWQWTSFNVISYEEVTFVVEKPQVSQTLGIGIFIAFCLLGAAWYKGLLRRIGLG